MVMNQGGSLASISGGGTEPGLFRFLHPMHGAR
jgi:hypothetical protein